MDVVARFPKFPWAGVAAVLVAAPALAHDAAPGAPLPQLSAYEVPESWRQPVAPLRITRDTWQVGTAGLSALLLVGDAGAILIDGGMPQAAGQVLANVEALGLAPDDVKLILHSHAHADHVGPLAELRRATGARVVTNAESAALLARGGADDIHYGDALLYPPVTVDRLVQDDEVVELGRLRLQVRFTPGHTPGSMGWTWQDASLDGRPLQVVYADSLSAPDYRLVDNPRYPRILEDYRASFATVRALPCDLLLTPHPAASGWRYGATLERTREIDCRAYADAADAALRSALGEATSTGADPGGS